MGWQNRGKYKQDLNGEIIGSSKMLSFEVKEDLDVIKKNHEYWIVHEYSLDSVSLDG